MRLALIALLAAACKPAPVARAADGSAIYEMRVTNDGFEPARIEAAPGERVVLRITRKTASTCADAIDVQGDPVRHMLPLDVAVEVKVVTPPSGELAFACPMKMIHGAIVAR
jgi:plastocyanin domain-containing protein